MKSILILITFLTLVNFNVFGDDDVTTIKSLNNLDWRKDIVDPGPARDLPRSERKRLRLLKALENHKIKKRDVNDNDENLKPIKKILQNRGNIKAIDTIKKDHYNNDAQNGSKNYEFAYNLKDQNRNEKLHFTRNSKKLNHDINGDNINEEEGETTAQGGFSFISADGFKYITKYVADNKGFRPLVLVEKI